jgi:hypothetical protein
MTFLHGRLVPALIGATVAGALMIVPTLRAAAQAKPQLVAFEAIASADGVRIGLNVPGAPLSSNVFDGGAPVVQAKVDGLGNSNALAAMPYPGELATTGPSLVFPLIGLPAPPAFPLIAASQYPNRAEGKVSDGAVELLAKSDQFTSSADGRGGGSSNGESFGNMSGHATASADTSSAVLTAEANSMTESVSIAGVLRIGSTRASAKVIQPPSGDRQRDSSFAADGVSTTGLQVSITPKGIVLPGSTAPVPDTSGASPVLDAAHVSIRYLPAETFDGGVMSAGMIVTAPGPATQGQGTVTFTFGRALALASSTVGELTPALSTSIGGGTASNAQTSSAPSSSGRLPNTSNPTTPSPASGGQPVVSARPSEAPLATLSAVSFYLVLVLGAVVAVFAASLLRIFGVRLAWMQ